MPPSGDGPVVNSTFVNAEKDPAPPSRTLADIRQGLRADYDPAVREAAIVEYADICLDVANLALHPDESIKIALTAKGVDPSWLNPETDDWRKRTGGAQTMFTSASLVQSFAADFPPIYQARPELVPQPDITKNSPLSRQRLTAAKEATERMYSINVRAAGEAFRLDQPVSASATAILDLHKEIPNLRQALQNAKGWAQAER